MRFLTLTRLAVASLLSTNWVYAEHPTTREDGVTVIHLDEYNGYFAAKETVGGLKNIKG